MKRQIRFLLLLLAVGTLGLGVFVFHPQAEEVESPEPPAVSESDLQMYIKVYTAMQDYHDLTIEEAIKPHNVSLDDFRQIERRGEVQRQLGVRMRFLETPDDHLDAPAILPRHSHRPTILATCRMWNHAAAQRGAGHRRDADRRSYQPVGLGSPQRPNGERAIEETPTAGQIA